MGDLYFDIFVNCNKIIYIFYCSCNCRGKYVVDILGDDWWKGGVRVLGEKNYLGREVF